MLYVCDQRFDVTKNLENFYELNKEPADDKDASEKNTNVFFGIIKHLVVFYVLPRGLCLFLP